MGTGNGSMVGMDPDLADVLVRELRAAEIELKACAAEVGAVLADVGEASFIPAELNQLAAWCAGEAGTWPGGPRQPDAAPRRRVGRARWQATRLALAAASRLVAGSG